MHLRTPLTLLCLPLLAACQWQSLVPSTLNPVGLLGSHEDRPPQRITWERTAPCHREDCTLVNIDTLDYPDDPQLTGLIEQALLRLADAPPVASGPEILSRYAELILHRQPAGREVWLQAKQIDQHDDLQIIELSSYLKDGQQGAPGRSFINYSRSQKRSLQPTDWLQDGQEFEFWNAVREAHIAWLKQQKLGDNRAFISQWPFRRTQNIALLSDRVRVKYEVNSIAPYQMGHPFLDIPYARLQNVLRPQYLPGSKPAS